MASSSSTTFNANDPAASGMVLTFDDEFDSNDTSNNGVASGTQWANHIWYDSADPGAVSVSNGVLSLAPGGELATTNTAGQGFSQEYGYFEIDMKLPSTNGSWPAFWLESLAHALDPNAPSSEIDVIEGQGVYPDGYWATLHYNSSSQGPAGADQQNANNFTGDLGTNLSSGFNRYGVLWSPNSDQITFYFNGNPVLTATDYSTTNSSAMMVLIDNWIGNMGAGVDNNGSGGGDLDVDYVRVYQFASQDPTAVVAQAVSPAAGQTDPTALANADGGTSGSGTTTSGGTSGGSTSGSGTSDPPPTPSANDTVVTGTSGDIVTAAHNTFAINASGEITENGAALSDTASVTELAYIGGTLYQENVANDWWSFNETTSTWTAVSDPLTTSSGSGSTSGSGTSDPPPPPSANDTVVTGTSGDIVTAAHNTFAINASGEITENGAALSDTASVTELAYIGGTLYQENVANDWWSFNETTSTWTAVSDPLTTTSGSGSTGSTGTSDPPPTPSANDTVVTGTSGDIVTAAHNTFAINAGGEITENGTALNDTASVTELAYIGGTLYQENVNNDWWSFNETTSTWTAVSNPLTTSSGSGSTGSTGTSDPPPTPSANDTVVAGTKGDIVTAAHNTFAINASGEITENGTALSDTASVTELAYIGGTLYQENVANDWWSFNETTSTWTAVSNPLTTSSGSGSTGSTGTSDPPPTPSANDTVVTGTSGDIVTAAHNTFAINASGEITENGTVMAETGAVTELAYVGGTLYQEATSKDLWWSYNETTNAWTSTSDPLPHAMAPNLSVYEAAGTENSAIPLYISAAQDSSALSASNLTVTVSGLDGAKLSAGTESNGVYTLTAAQLSGLTLTPANGFTGTLDLQVQATDTEAGLNNHASSVTDTLDIAVTAPSTSEAMLSPSFTDGTHSVYMLSWPPESDAHIADFDPSTDILDLAPLLAMMGYKGTDPVGQHIVDLEATSNGGTAVVIDPSGDDPSHGTTVVTLDHVLPQSVPAADIWH